MFVGVASLLGGPGLDGGGICLLRVCAGSRRGRKAGCGKVDRADGLGVISGEPGADAGAEITPMRDIVLIPKGLKPSARATALPPAVQ